MLLYVLLTGRQPFSSPKTDDPMVVMRRIVDDNWHIKYPPYLSPSAKVRCLRQRVSRCDMATTPSLQLNKGPAHHGVFICSLAIIQRRVLSKQVLPYHAWKIWSVAITPSGRGVTLCERMLLHHAQWQAL